MVLYDPYSLYLYPWMGFNLFLGHWLLSAIVRSGLLAITHSELDITFSKLAEDKKRNVITYVLQCIFTTFALVLQLYGGTDLLFRLDDETSKAKMDAMVLSLTMVSVLYIWELVYREKIGLPLLVHHIVTLLLIQTSYVSFFDTHNIKYVRYAVLLGFHATTEQTTFMALFCFRLGLCRPYQQLMFYFSSIQAFIIKSGVTIITIILVIHDLYVKKGLDDDPTQWNWYWKVLILPLLAALYASQVYASWILYLIGKKCGRKPKPQQEQHVDGTTASEDNDSEVDANALDAFENTVNMSMFKKGTTTKRLQATVRVVQAQLRAKALSAT
eukprot:scaffold7231_cov94-Amphora_coffeaeformis.AAC.1